MVTIYVDPITAGWSTLLLLLLVLTQPWQLILCRLLWRLLPLLWLL